MKVFLFILNLLLQYSKDLPVFYEEVVYTSYSMHTVRI